METKPAYYTVVIAVAGLLAQGCAMLQPHTQAEAHSAFTYVPLEPLRIKKGSSQVELPNGGKLIDALPDHTVRMALREQKASGEIKYAASSASTKGSRYEINLDYIASDTREMKVWVAKMVTNADIGKQGEVTAVELFGDQETMSSLFKRKPSIRYRVWPAKKDDVPGRIFEQEKKAQLITLPVYIGVGLRITAQITAIEGNVNLSGLGAIAAAAQAGQVNGMLVVQALGITGKMVPTTMPLPQELNQTTIQQAILAVGALRAVFYDGYAVDATGKVTQGSTPLQPRIVGFYNSIGGDPTFVNGVYSVLADQGVEW